MRPDGRVTEGALNEALIEALNKALVARAWSA